MLYFSKLNFDFLKFVGSDRLDLINRLSTNEVKSLKKYGGKKTILTTEKGRFADLLTLYNFGDFVFSLCSGGNAGNVLSHLDKYTIMDDFKPTDMSGTHEVIHFYGEVFAEFAKQEFDVDLTGFGENDFSVCSVDSHDSIIAMNDDPFGGFYFIYASGDREFWEKKTEPFEAKYHLSHVSELEYEAERIEKGIPVLGKEMSGLTNPLECGLGKYVSFTKGCYIGQEVIARLDAYDKINRHLVGFKTNQLIPEGAKITTDDKECGYITSSAYSEKFGYISLGFVKTIFLSFEKEFKIKTETGQIDCTITKLPFNLN